MEAIMKRLRYLLIISVIVGLFGCGGGGGNSDDTTNNNSQLGEANSDFEVIDNENATAEIAEISMDDNDEISLTINSNSSLGENLEVGSVVTALPGVDDRFPFGLSGKVSSTATNSDGSKTITLEEVALSDFVYSTEQETSTALNANNFIGVIAPSATQATEEASASSKSITAATYSITKQALNGGVIVRERRWGRISNIQY